MTRQRIDHVDYAARRRAELAKWLETFERMLAVKPRRHGATPARFKIIVEVRNEKTACCKI